jgi:hypothetical protein
MGEFTRSGSLIAAEAQDRADAAKAAARSNRSRFESEVRRAMEAGFSEREAPFAAITRLTRGPTTVAVMREHLRCSMPWLYEEA